MFSNNRINNELWDGIGNFGFETISRIFLQFEDLHFEWTSNLKVMLIVSYGNRVVYVHREKNIYIFHLLDYTDLYMKA